jgi:hypothetical protein
MQNSACKLSKLDTLMREISVLNIYNAELCNAKLLPVCLELMFSATSSVTPMASHCEFLSLILGLI